MKAADLREKSVDDLRELEKTLAHDVFQNRLKNFTNRLDDTSAIRKSRRDLARVITLLRERDKGLSRTASVKARAVPSTETKAATKAEAKPAAATEAKPKKSVAKKSSTKKSEAK